MGKEDYASSGGALKLKGVGGISKGKKKKKAAKPSTTPDTELEASTASDGGKTEAERRFEARRQKMLEDRVKKDGVKSHKARVEEYNAYLASLSEHHDMPRIGPG